MLSRKGPATALSAGTKRWDGTVAGDRGNKSLDMDVVRLLKTQDMGYIRTVRNVAMKEVQQLEERVISLGGDLDTLLHAEDEDEDDMDFDFGAEMKPRKSTFTKSKKIVFTDAEDEREDRIRQDTEQHSPEVGEGDAKSEKETPEKRAEEKQKLLEKLQRRLQNARKKQRVLAEAEQALEVQRAKMAKTATMGGTTKTGKKFKVRERKR